LVINIVKHSIGSTMRCGSESEPPTALTDHYTVTFQTIIATSHRKQHSE